VNCLQVSGKKTVLFCVTGDASSCGEEGFDGIGNSAWGNMEMIGSISRARATLILRAIFSHDAKRRKL
jgi:hypothetical protein